MKHAYTVTMSLPQQELTVYARDESEAAFTAWNMIGLAGVKEFGLVAVKQIDPTEAVRPR